MILETVVCLVVHCSRCNKTWIDDEGCVRHFATLDEASAPFVDGWIEDEDGWLRVGDRVVCPDCYEHNYDEGEWVELPPLPGVDEASVVRQQISYADPTHAGRRALAIALLEHLEAGDIPGSTIRHRGEQISIHTFGQVEGWLRAFLEGAGLIEQVEDDFGVSA